MFDVIAFDADDTLWHNEVLFEATQQRFAELVEPHLDTPWTGEALFAAEMRNLAHFGYGVKGFMLSMIETAIEVTQGRIPAAEIGRILELGKEMLNRPVELIDGAVDVVTELSRDYRLMLITKGDLHEQERKIARSGMAGHFAHVEIVSDKTVESYRSVLASHGIASERFLMVGNSLRSDILPVLELGGQAAWVPYHVTWAHEVVDGTTRRDYHELSTLRELPTLLASLAVQAPGAASSNRVAKPR